MQYNIIVMVQFWQKQTTKKKHLQLHLLSAVTLQQILPLLLSDARGREEEEEDRWPQSGDGGSGRPPV